MDTANFRCETAPSREEIIPFSQASWHIKTTASGKTVFLVQRTSCEIGRNRGAQICAPEPGFMDGTVNILWWIGRFRVRLRCFTSPFHHPIRNEADCMGSR